MTRALQRKLPVSSCDDARWEAVVARDPSFDGQFYYSVETTGVYCRPSCASIEPHWSKLRDRSGFHPRGME